MQFLPDTKKYVRFSVEIRDINTGYDIYQNHKQAQIYHTVVKRQLSTDVVLPVLCQKHSVLPLLLFRSVDPQKGEQADYKYTK